MLALFANADYGKSANGTILMAYTAASHFLARKTKIPSISADK